MDTDKNVLTRIPPIDADFPGGCVFQWGGGASACRALAWRRLIPASRWLKNFPLRPGSSAASPHQSSSPHSAGSTSRLKSLDPVGFYGKIPV